jgi:hypothetical protein
LALTVLHPFFQVFLRQVEAQAMVLMAARHGTQPIQAATLALRAVAGVAVGVVRIMAQEFQAKVPMAARAVVAAVEQVEPELGLREMVVQALVHQLTVHR